MLEYVDLAAVERFDAAVRGSGVWFEAREHEHARHARHLASLWGGNLHDAARATLLAANGSAVLAVLPADRKIGAPRLRALLGAADLRVLRGDRGVGRVGWLGLLPPPGVLPAVPGLFGAASIVDELATLGGRLIVALSPTRSLALAPGDYVRLTGARVLRFAGTTRLLPQGGMVDDDAYAAGG